MADQTKSEDNVTLTNGSLILTENSTDCAGEAALAKMAGAAISKCPPPEEDDMVSSKSGVVSPGTDVLESSNDLSTSQTTMKSVDRSEENPFESLFAKKSKKSVNVEGSDGLRSTDGVGGNEQNGGLSVVRDEEQTEGCLVNDTDTRESGDSGSASDDTECLDSPRAKDRESSEEIEDKIEDEPTSGVSDDTEKGEQTGGKAESETNESKVEEHVTDVSEKEKNTPKDVLMKSDTPTDVCASLTSGDGDASVKDAGVDHDKSSCEHPDADAGFDQDTVSDETEEMLGETYISSNKECETLKRVDNKNLDLVSEEGNSCSTEEYGPASADGLLEELDCIKDKCERLASEGSKCCKDDGETLVGNVANENNVGDDPGGKSDNLVEANVPETMADDQVKSRSEEITSDKSDEIVSQKQLAEEEKVLGDKLHLEILQKSNYEMDIADKNHGEITSDKGNSGESSIETDANTDDNSNSQDTLPDTSRKTDSEEVESEDINADSNCSSKDISVAKFYSHSADSCDKAIDEPGKEPGVTGAAGKADHLSNHDETSEKLCDKEQPMDTSCEETKMAQCDNGKGVAPTVGKEESPVAVSSTCIDSKPKREPRAKMMVSPSRAVSTPCSISNTPDASTSFASSRNKLAAARKTLVNLVSNKGWCSIVKQAPKFEESPQLGVAPTSDGKATLNKVEDKKPGAAASTRLTIIKGADGKRFLIKTPVAGNATSGLTIGQVTSRLAIGQVVKEVILVSNPTGLKPGVTNGNDAEPKTFGSGAKSGIVATVNKENSCSMPTISTSASDKPPVKQKARKSAHQTARKAQVVAYNKNNRTLNPFANMTIKVPDLENALGIKEKSLDKLDAKTLDKILLDNVQRAVRKPDADVHKGTTPSANLSTILVGQSILRRKKRRRMGLYKLPELQRKQNKAKKSGLIAAHDKSDATNGSAMRDDDTGKNDIGKLLGQMKKRKRPRMWALGKVARSSAKARTTKLQSKDDKLPHLMEGTDESTQDDQNSDLIGSRRSQRKRKGTAVEDTHSAISTKGVSDISTLSTSQAPHCCCADHDEPHVHSSTVPKQRRVEWEGADLPVLLPPCTLYDAPDGQSAPPTISPQKAPCSGGKAPCGGVSSRGSLTDRMVYTHPLGRLPGELEQKLNAIAPQQSDGPKPSCGSLLQFVNTPNGMTFPLSPAKPDDDTSKYPVRRQCKTGQMSGDEMDRDFIPLCCCKINGASFANLKQVIYCQALDSIDGKVVGCCNKVTNGQLVRSAVKIPFMAVCEQHRKRLRLHQCCPGCGHFCTQGKFYQCKKEGAMGVHHFHKGCQVFRDSKYYCSHCGNESHQVEVNLKLHDPTKLSMQSRRPQRLSTVGPRARMGVTSPQSSPSLAANEDIGVSVRTTSTNKEISTAGMPLGPSRKELENIITLIGSNEKPKKLRANAKNLYAAAYSGEVEKVLAILLEGVDPNVQFEEFNKQTALQAAAIGGYLSIVHLLIQAGASPHITDQNLCTAAICAAEFGQTAVVRYLIKAGAVPDARGQDSMTCLHLAAKCGSVDTVKYLVEMTDTEVNIKDDGGWTPLIWATESCHLAVVKYMLLVGADPNMRDNEENTGLHWAAYAGCVDVAELFLNAGCNLEAANEHGDRPLHIAARQDHYECIVLFLARGADSEARNNNNKSAISCCVDESGQVWMALRVNKQLKGFATQRLHQPEQLLHRDISMGREANPLPVVNGVDEENYPTDFQYLMNNAETSPMNINRVITSLQCCQCRDNCCSTFCICSRNSVKCWYDKEGTLLSDFNYMDPPLIFECNKACSCWANCRNRVIQLGITCRLQVIRTTGRGWGVRTLLNIPQGTFVCEYVGELISDTVADNREDDSYLFDLDNKESDTYCIDARRYGNVSRFINHLCEPNLLPVKVFVEHQDLRFPRMCFFATRDIKANEELGFDYGEKFWIIKWKHFTCTCASPKCKYSATTIHQTISDYNHRMAEES